MSFSCNTLPASYSILPCSLTYCATPCPLSSLLTFTHQRCLSALPSPFLPSNPSPYPYSSCLPPLRRVASSYVQPNIYFPSLPHTPYCSSTLPSLHETRRFNTPFRPRTHAHTDASRECLHEHICKSAFGFTGKVTLVLSSVRLVLSAPRGCSV